MEEKEKRKLADSHEQIVREEDARKRRIQMRREQDEKRRRADRRRRNIRNSYLAILWLGVIGGGFIVIAWNWMTLVAWFR